MVIPFAFSVSLALAISGPPETAFAASVSSSEPATTSAPASAAGLDAPNLPTVLSTLDASRYAAIFALQEEGNWKAADGQIDQLKDKSLLGEVLAQRYLATRYHASFAEARDWLEHYADLPQAHAVWQLARKRAPGKSVPKPVPATEQVASPTDGADDLVEMSGRPLPAEPRLIGLESPARYEAGLAAWRAKKWAEAANDFESVTRNGTTASWYVAASAFWAARAHLRLKEPQKVNGWLATAAEQPRTFYGMLARRLLGLSPDSDFEPQPLSKAEVAQLQALPGGRRALALVQVGETDRAEAELRALSTRGNKSLASAIVGLGDLANMPALCLALGRQQSRDDPRQIESQYPVPRWRPRNGFSVDRALLFALMMQESRFDTEAQSGSGAAGLMQLMPGTAKSVARRAGIPLGNVAELVDPVLNLSLGQEYVKQLIGHQQINGNLILVLATYNSGTAPLTKWQNKPEYQSDPLMFIESLPRDTTRLYVERVLTNMWIYRQRLGEDAPDLESLAAGQWPAYVSMDAATQGSAQHAETR
ncbi:MAG: soluble lytic murein transglycosylase [Aliidongia sp.]|nr:soluble lytic murein transglycosylase [Aliidongia sp.]